MNNKQKIIMLKQYRILLLEYKVKNSHYLQLREKLMFPAPENQKLSSMPINNSVSNQIEQNYIKLESLESEMRQRQSKIIETLQKLESSIHELENSWHRTILILRYIEGYTWERICCQINYEWRQTHRMHSQALKDINLDMAHNGTY